jgi:hypothetical protein
MDAPWSVCDADHERVFQLDKSGRRESNPRSQLGKTLQADAANDGELERQVSEPADAGKPLRTDPDAP